MRQRRVESARQTAWTPSEGWRRLTVPSVPTPITLDFAWPGHRPDRQGRWNYYPQSEQLLQGHERASNTFGSGYASDYLPHLSLVYGHLQRTKKTSLRNEVEDKLPPDFVTDRLQLVHIAVSVPDWRVVITSPLRA